MLKIGIIGLPNVGKSSLFQLITKSDIEIANYPFATIDANIGIVELPDKRLQKLADFYQSKKIIAPLIKFWDIAGLVKGASEGQGMGNKFLSHIHEADALIHVVRCFEEEKIIHVHDEVAPENDWETINLELILADLELIQKKLSKIRALKRSDNSSEIIAEENLLKRIETYLKAGKLLFNQEWTREEKKYLRTLNLLNFKKTLVLINIGEKDYENLEQNKLYQNFVQKLSKQNVQYLTLSIAFERAINDLNEEEAEQLRQEFHVPSQLFQNFLRESYKMLNLSTFFTAGPKETRGWSFPNNANAKDCAGIIHTDFAKGFIRCEVIAFEKLLEAGSEQLAKEKGLLRTEGKDYLVQDGDICHFLFNV